MDFGSFNIFLVNRQTKLGKLSKKKKNLHFVILLYIFICRPENLLSLFTEITHAVCDILNNYLTAGPKTCEVFLMKLAWRLNHYLAVGLKKLLSLFTKISMTAQPLFSCMSEKLLSLFDEISMASQPLFSCRSEKTAKSFYKN